MLFIGIPFKIQKSFVSKKEICEFIFFTIFRQYFCAQRHTPEDTTKTGRSAWWLFRNNFMNENLKWDMRIYAEDMRDVATPLSIG